MQSAPLKHPPLVEAILEAKWQLKEGGPQGLLHDPSYSLLVGRLHARIEKVYPCHELLPAAIIPDELTPYQVKHRFRVAENRWPLVQVGPGVVTFNETQNYDTYAAFHPKAVALIRDLYEAYPEPGGPRINALLLRYIDAVQYDYHQDSVWDFLREKMHVPVALPERFFCGVEVENQPSRFVWESSFSCAVPKGTATLRFATGNRQGGPAIIWEQMLRTDGEDMVQMPDEFPSWLDSAHAVTEDWFLKIIEGDLMQEFNRD